MDLLDKIRSNPEFPIRTRSLSGMAALVCSCLAVIILAFLIPFGVLQSCSAANITTFVTLFGLSALLVLSGIVIGGVSNRKAKNRLAVTSLLVAVLYVALLIYLIQIMYS